MHAIIKQYLHVPFLTQTRDYDDVIKATQDFTANYYGASPRPASFQSHAIDPDHEDTTVRRENAGTPDESTCSITCVFPDSPPHCKEAKGGGVALPSYTKMEPEVFAVPHVNVHLEVGE